jgi:hypothetical protein
MDDVKKQLALQCVLMALQNRVPPLKGETMPLYAARLHEAGENMLKVLLAGMEPDDDGGDGSPGYSEADDVSQEYEPEETLTDDVQVQTVELQDGTVDTFDPSAESEKVTKDLWIEWEFHSLSATCPQCEKCATGEDVERDFGFRRMKVQTKEGVKVLTVRQSWCRSCRLEALKEKANRVWTRPTTSQSGLSTFIFNVMTNTKRD